MDLADFNYTLPPELIATHPAPERDASRLMIVRRDASPFEHRGFSDLPGLLRAGDLLVVNNSKVIPARLHVRRPGGGGAELLLTQPLEGGVWEAIVRPARKLRPGMRLALPGGAGYAEIVASTSSTMSTPSTPRMEPRANEGPPEDEGRLRRVRFVLNDPARDLMDFLNLHGEVPLPPYILQQRKAHGEAGAETPEDRQRYQTVYAQPPGSIAAPTAGLHFTPAVLEALQARGIEIRRITLHVGIGTFEPIQIADFEKHVMHSECYSIGEQEAAAIERARAEGRRIVAVGTTSVRALEACFARHGRIAPVGEATNIFIYPGFRFNVAQALLTNFHLPGSTLMLLVAAFAGRERILDAYREATLRRYRFYSYGDAMLIE